MKATILAVLNGTQGPVTTSIIALRLAQDRRLPHDDERVRKLLLQRVGAALFHLERRGEVRRVGRLGRFTVWENTKALNIQEA